MVAQLWQIAWSIKRGFWHRDRDGLHHDRGAGLVPPALGRESLPPGSQVNG